MNRNFQITTCLAFLAVATLLQSGPVSRLDAQVVLNELPENVRGVRVDDKVGEYIPLDLLFTDEKGNKVSLGKFFKKGKPIILTLNYSDCPGLCIAQLDNLVDNFRGVLGKDIGDKFDIITVSIDPTEGHSKALATKAKYVGLLKDTKADEAWHFLVGDGASIRKLAETVGFVYNYDKVNRRYNHAAVTYFVSPEGRLCRYFLSLGVEPDQLKLAIGEANEGLLNNSLTDAIVQLCYMYDPNANRYTASARKLMSLGGAVFAMMLFGLTAPFWFGRRGAAKPPTDANDAASTAASGYIKTGSDAITELNPKQDSHE